MQRIVYNRFSILYIEFKNLNMIEKKNLAQACVNNSKWQISDEHLKGFSWTGTVFIVVYKVYIAV